jgi:hypothetical protein
VLDVNMVESPEPFQSTWESVTNCVPVTVSMVAALPAVALDGDIDVIVGTGFGALIVKATVAEVPPPGAGF